MTSVPRYPDGFDWARLATPLLVQSDGWAQLVVNLGSLLLFGTHAERAFGRARWLLLYLGAGLVGQALGYAREPAGAGNSVAVCGLAGWTGAGLAPVAVAVLICALDHHGPAPLVGVLFGLIPGGARRPAGRRGGPVDSGRDEHPADRVRRTA